MLFNSPAVVLNCKEGQNAHIEVCICKNDKSLNEKAHLASQQFDALEVRRRVLR